MTRSASICSVTFIVEISAVMAAPTRPAQTTPTSTGPSSRPMAIAMTAPIVLCAPNLMNSCAVCSVSTTPVKRSVSDTIDSESTPRCDICAKICRMRGRCVNCRIVSAYKRTIDPNASQRRSTNAPSASKNRKTIASPPRIA